MVSDLKIKISDVLGKYLKDTPMPEKQAIALVDELANLLASQPSAPRIFRNDVICPMCQQEGHFGDECPNI